MKHLEMQLKDFGQQFNEQIKCIESKVVADSSILNNIQEIYKRRAAIEQSYADNLLKLSSSIAQRNNVESAKRPKWKNYSPVQVLNSLIVSTEHTARVHRNLGDIYGKQMTQRIMDMQEDSSRLTKRSTEILLHRHTQILQSVSKLSAKQKNYTRLYQEADELKRKANKVLDQLNRDVIKNQEKKRELSKNFKIKKLKEDYLEKYKVFKDKYADCCLARNNYIIYLNALKETINHFYSKDLSAVVKCAQYGFHNKMTRLVMSHSSCEEALVTVHSSIRDLFCATGDQIDGTSDNDVFFETYRSVFSPKDTLRFYPAKDDSVDIILKIEKKIESDLQKKYDKFDSQYKNILKENLDRLEKISSVSKDYNDLINQMDFDVLNYVRGQSTQEYGTKERSSSVAQEKSNENLYCSIQRRVKESRLQKEICYFKLMAEYMDNEILITDISARLKNIDPVLKNPLDVNEVYYGQRENLHHETELMVGIKSKLFTGDLRKYSLEKKEMIPLVVRSCIRLINLYGMRNIGVFRVPGSQVDVQLFKAQFEVGADPNRDLTGNSNDINLAASLLKLYFRELSPPVFDEEIFAKIGEKYNGVMHDEKAIIEFMKEFVLKLHPAVYATVTYLLSFLDHLSEFSADNCMDVANLAMIFGPCLMPIPEDKGSQLFQSQAMINHITQCLITNRDKIFTQPSRGPNYHRDYSLQTPDCKNAAEFNSASFFDDSIMTNIEEDCSNCNDSLQSTRKQSFDSQLSSRQSLDTSRSRNQSTASSVNFTTKSDDESSVSIGDAYGEVGSQDNNQHFHDQNEDDGSSVGSHKVNENGEVMTKISIGSMSSDFELGDNDQNEVEDIPLFEIPPEFADTTVEKSPASCDSIAFIDAPENPATPDPSNCAENVQNAQCEVVKMRSNSRAIPLVSPDMLESMDTVDDERLQTQYGLQQIEQRNAAMNRCTIHLDNERLASKFFSPLWQDQHTVMVKALESRDSETEEQARKSVDCAPAKPLNDSVSLRIAGPPLPPLRSSQSQRVNKN